MTRLLSRQGVAALALASFLVVALSAGSREALAHGDIPDACPNRYDSEIVSMTINNGTDTFDPVADPGVAFDAMLDRGYDVEFTVHTANVSSDNNTSPGSTWYTNTANGYAWGTCIDGVGPDQDVDLEAHGGSTIATEGLVRFATLTGDDVQFNVRWLDGSASAASEQEPAITVDANFATFSYGVVYVGVVVKNAMPDIDKVEIEFYNPDGGLEGSKSQTLSIHNGTGMTGCYCFEIERKYVEESYKVKVIYGDYSETEVMEPFSSTYGQPPTISFHAAGQEASSNVHIGGRVSGGIGGEQVNVAIYPQDGESPLWEKTIDSNGKAIFEAFINGSEAQDLFPTGTYRVVATHVATGVTGETTLDYTNPSSPEGPEPAPQPQQPKASQSDDSENDEESVDSSRSDGMIRSPFVFNDEESDSPVVAASLPAESSSVAQASSPDALVINGTLASYYILDGAAGQTTTGTQLYILSGNWSMTANSTAVSGFAANFTIVRSDGAIRSAYSIANLAAVNASDVQFGRDSMVFASAADMQGGANASRENLIFTMTKLSVIKIEFGDDPLRPLGRPIYGVVDSLAHIADGQKSVLAIG